MRFFRIPSEIVVKLGEQSGKLTFYSFMENAANDKKLGQNLAGIRASVAILQSLEGKSAGEVVKLSDSVFDLLKDVIENPSEGYLPPVVRQVLPYIDAVLSATTEYPVDATTETKSE